VRERGRGSESERDRERAQKTTLTTQQKSLEIVIKERLVEQDRRRGEASRQQRTTTAHA
jgi:hypothetical protein